MSRRAIGIVRVSKDRDGESPGEQRDRIIAACKRDGLELLRVHDELDVSGGAPLAKRPGLSEAVAAVEAGEAEVVVAAYFDRLIRSLKVQAELVERVEAAGGQVLAVDVGQVTHDSAGQWLSGTMMGAVSEYQRRTTAERAGEAQARAVARGVVPWANITPGYDRGPDGVLVPAQTAPAVARAFEMRAEGATIAEVRAHLADSGIVRSYRSVQLLLSSRVVLGEIHFGKLVNLKAHEPIVDLDLWKRVQRIAIPRGRGTKSEMLLARLGVLRCATCESLMVAGSQTQAGRRYTFYRCCKVRQDCARRATISANVVEGIVVERVRAAIAGVEERASAEQGIRDAVEKLERAQGDLDAALRAFAGLEDEGAARERLAELRQARDDAQAQVDQLGGQGAAMTVSGATDWERLTLEERRALIRAVVERAVVRPGRGTNRVYVHLLGE